MGLNAIGLNYALDQLKAGNKLLYAALFTDDASTTEISGGSPAYSRKSVTWDVAGAGGAGKIQLTGTLPTFDVPACTIKSIAIYDALTAGNQYAKFDISPDEIFAAQGTYALTAGSITIT